jgi:hypothetical protein
VLIHPHVVHRIGDNDSDGTVAALLNCYKMAAAVDREAPAGNLRPLAEMPVALAMGGAFIFMRPCLFCMENH